MNIGPLGCSGELAPSAGPSGLKYPFATGGAVVYEDAEGRLRDGAGKGEAVAELAG